MARTIARDHDEKRARILQSAARVFAREGVARASMSLVARDCGISKAGIYHYYASKDALLFDILDTYLRTLRDRLRALPLESLAPACRLRRFMAETLLAYEGMDSEHKIQIDGIHLLAKDRQDILKGYQRDMVAQLNGILADIVPDSVSGDSRRLRAASMSVFGMLNWFHMWNGKADRAGREDYVEFAARIALNGLRGL